MVILKRKEDILKKIKCGYPYWVLYHDNEKVSEYSGASNAEKSYAELLAELELYEPTTFCVRLYKVPGNIRHKGGNNITDRISFEIHTGKE